RELVPDQAAALAAAVPAPRGHGPGQVVAAGGTDDPPRRFTAAHERQRHVAVQPALAARPDADLGAAAAARRAGRNRGFLAGGVAQACRLSTRLPSAAQLSAAIPTARQMRRLSAATTPTKPSRRCVPIAGLAVAATGRTGADGS